MNHSAKSDRIAITMWDFSWLLRRQGSESEYADFDKVLDELVERGYNGVRIDAFPHLISYLEDSKDRKDEFTILPQTYSLQWGSRSNVTTSIKPQLIEFMSKCRDRELRVALSTWFVPDTLNLRDTIHTPQDFAHVWKTTLKFLEREGFSDIIEYVDICNEFPFAGWSPCAYKKIFNTSTSNILPYFIPWSERAKSQAQIYIDEVVQALKQEFDYNLTFSSMRLPRKEESIDYSKCDILEVHVWLSDTVAFGLLSGALLSTAQLPFGASIHSYLAPYLYPVLRKMWIQQLDSHMQDVADIAHRLNKPLYCTEGWATTMYGTPTTYHNHQKWSWIKDICEEGVKLAISKGWHGICTSNFSQPHFEAIWQDVKWHKRLNSQIRAS